MFANDTAVTQAADQGQSRSGSIHYLRTQNPENPEVMAGYPSRLQTNRSNPYIAPGGYMKLKTEGHLETYGPQGCGTTANPAPPAPLDPWLPAGVVNQIRYYTFGYDQNLNAAPPCDPQTPLGQTVRPGRSVPAAPAAALAQARGVP